MPEPIEIRLRSRRWAPALAGLALLALPGCDGAPRAKAAPGAVDLRRRVAAPAPDDGGGAPVDGAPAGPRSAAVLTQHNDNQRTGAQLRESVLTPTAVLTHGLRLAVTRPVDAAVLTQLLYVPALSIGGTPRDVVFAATLKNSVYAYDLGDTTASGTSSGLVWKTPLFDPESPLRKFPRGIQSTPVIDLAARELFVLYQTKDTAIEPLGESTVDVAFWLAALDLETGTPKRQVKVTARVPRADGSTLDFLPRNHRNRPALLLDGGMLYAAFGARSKEGQIEYHGWVLRWDARTLAPRGAFCLSPNVRAAGAGAGIWQGSAGLVADDQGAVYVLSGNGDRDAAAGTYGNAFLKITGQADALGLAGWFAPDDPLNRLQLNDVDLGSGGPALLPGTRRLAGGGKTGILYLVDTDAMRVRQAFQGFINVYDPTFVVDSNWEGGPHLHGAPVVWQGADPGHLTLYAWAENDYLRAYTYDRARDLFDTTPRVGSILAVRGIMPGGMISLSADADRAGSAIVWASLPASDVVAPDLGDYPGRLVAFDGETLAVLWETSFPSIPKWIPPTIADGRVLVPTAQKELEVYTLAP